MAVRQSPRSGVSGDVPGTLVTDGGGRMKRTTRVALAMMLAVFVPTLVGANDPCAAQDTPRILASYTVSDYGLGAVQNLALPGSVTNDRGFLLSR